jgi:RNA polymerase sigma-70 factor (ECF subfamily)
MTESFTYSQTRPSLLLRIRDPQDAKAWETFTTTYAPLVVGFCRRRGLQGADADDVTQEVFTRLSRTIRGFEYEPARGRFRDWLGTMVHNEICRFVNRHQRHMGAGADVPTVELEQPAASAIGPEWEEHFHTHILACALDEIRSQFEPQTWLAFELVWLRDQPSAKVAADLNMDVAAVYVAKSRVLRRLREKLLELSDEIPMGVVRP